MPYSHLPHFTLVEPQGLGLVNPVAADLALLERLAADPGHPLAQLWTAPTCLVVPRSYQRHAALDAVRERFAAQGCPVYLRSSGGGLVPQGPGMLNLSLAYVVRGMPGEWAEPVYLHLCEMLRGPLHSLGLATHWQAVEGSFCDGRFNLACTHEGRARKIAGTAQYWRPLPAPPGTAPGSLRAHAVLAHAVLLVDADLPAAHVLTNGFEQALDSSRHYDPDSTINVAQALAPAQGPGNQADTMQALHSLLADSVCRCGPPGKAETAVSWVHQCLRVVFASEASFSVKIRPEAFLKLTLRRFYSPMAADISWNIAITLLLNEQKSDRSARQTGRNGPKQAFFGSCVLTQ